MNCFSHAFPLLDDPYMAVGASLPDWLGAVNRRVRVREQAAEKFVDESDSRVAALARGIARHHQDDRWFHQAPPFVDLSMRLAVESRSLLGQDAGFRPGLLGHIIIELLLDAYLDTNFPGRLEAYYQAVQSVSPELVQQTVNRIAKHSTDKLTWYFDMFLRERYVFDYIDDQRMLYRLNRVFQRVRLSPIGTELDAWLPTVRRRVYDQADRLLGSHVSPADSVALSSPQ